MRCQDRDCGSAPVYATQRSSAPAMTQGSASGHVICVKRRMSSRGSIVRCRRLFRTPASIVHDGASNVLIMYVGYPPTATKSVDAHEGVRIHGAQRKHSGAWQATRRDLLRLVPITSRRLSSLEEVTRAARTCRVHEASTLRVRTIYVIPARHRVIIVLRLRRFTYVVDNRERALCDS